VNRVFTLALLAITLYAIPRVWAANIYVLPIGDDGADGASPLTAFRTITHAAARARPGDRIVVGAGEYNEGDITPAAFGRVSFVADRRGIETGGGPGNVVVNATGYQAGFELNHNLAVTIDGFVVYGAGIGVYVKSQSDQAEVSNSVISNNVMQGIYVQDSKNVVVFNNLVYNNGRSGILVTGNVSGSSNTQVINNTVYGNGDRGIFFSGTTVNSPGGLVLNNIVQGNAVAGIQVNEGSRVDYVSAGNVAVDRFASGAPVDITDTTPADAMFINPAGPDGVLGGAGNADDDFHLSDRTAGQVVTSPAINAGSDLARSLRLASATTRADSRADRGLVDAGYHYRNFGPPPPQPGTHVRYVPIFVDPTHGSDSNHGATAATALHSLSRALDLARPGSRVVMLAGTYRPDSTNGELSLYGKPGREIVVHGEPGAVVDATGFDRGIRIVGPGNVSLDGFDVRNASIAGIEINHGAKVDVSGSSVSTNVGRGLWALQGSTVSVSNSRFDGNGKTGILAQDTDTEVTLSDSTFCDNRQEGLRQRGGSAQVVRVAVTGNHSKGVSVDGLTHFSLQDSFIGSNGDNGVQVATTTGPLLSNCIIYSNLGDGVTLLDSPAAQLMNNLIYGNVSSGVLISGDATGSPNAQVLNNTIFGNGNRGLLIGGSNLKPPSQGATVLRNIFQANATVGLQVNELSLPGHVGDYNLSADAYGALTPIGMHDVLADPLLVNPAGMDGILGGDGAADDDFHLNQRLAGQDRNSPAVDTGGIDVESAGLYGTTTRTDSVADSGVVDLGFHYPIGASYAAGATGDCDGDGQVTVSDLLRGVAVALGQAPFGDCPSLDFDGDGKVTFTDLLRGVRLALGG
jgi:parallel beta-helix repeat protein